MATVEQLTKAAFARCFKKSDWRLFKAMADAYFSRAASLRNGDVSYVPSAHRLLFRNAQKRLFIGVGAELLLKALYLKSGFAINRPPAGSTLRFPFTVVDASGIDLEADSTFMLGDLIDKLSKVPAFAGAIVPDRGLRIAKVFRNKEGHVVLPVHKYSPGDYRDIERSLVAIYRLGFSEELKVRFSIGMGERAVWRVE